ncbi:GNAT family N-acetyltransferase [Mesorhizobium sp. ZC-5]|uniref:GNAT family N-acetyltransferase n=1 Tax=Mesorhizobium sp. ZC-5 TaxID=2986066 RepID=UPI0021E85B61|nr:GNAT family N-acetyltransferase [Mesorhizobium sp. ZC-5]MCV3243913.1 GNAT family N-acetyltransferase [Mesorhizobium sp. ZC-5]
MSLTIREFGVEDIELVLPLFLEMERHYEGDKAVDEETARARVAKALARKGENLFFGAFMPEMVGFAIVCEIFPGPDLRSQWHLKDLFVSDRSRGGKVGERLIRAAAKSIVARGGTRLAFTTGQDNLGAQRFYDRLGASRIPKVIVYGFDNEALVALANG